MEISSSWPSENGPHIRDIAQESDTLPSGDLADLLDVEKCISLVRTSRELCHECSLRFSSRSLGKTKKKSLKGLTILSEARVIEICVGIHEEYYRSVHGSLMGDFGDSKIYVCEINFEKPQDIVLLRLKSTCENDSLWIYGLHVAVDTLAVQGTCATSNFSNEHLSPLLRDKGVQLSKDADKFRHMLEGFNSNGSGSDLNNRFGVGNPMALMSMMFGSKFSKPFNTSSAESELDAKNGNDFRPGDEELINREKEPQNRPMSKLINTLSAHLMSDNGNLHTDMNVESLLNHQNRPSEKCIDFKKRTNLENGANVIIDDDGDLTTDKQKEIKKNECVDSLMNKLQELGCDDKIMNKDMDRFGSLIGLLARPGTLPKEKKPTSLSVDPMVNKESTCVQEDMSRVVCRCACKVEIDEKLGQLVEEKVTAMEERLLKKIEQKLEKQAEIDDRRLKRVEELFSKIYDKL